MDRGVLFGILFDFLQVPERFFHAVHVAGHEFGDFCKNRKPVAVIDHKRTISGMGMFYNGDDGL